MPIKLTDLINRVPAEVKGRVKRVRDQYRAVLQEALRAECRLVMRTPEEIEEGRGGAQVPIEIAPGHPAVLADVEFPDDLELVLLLSRYRSALQQLAAGALGCIPLCEELSRRASAREWTVITPVELQSCADWAAALLRFLNQHDPMKIVQAVRDDYLGVYVYDANNLLADEYAVNRATIRIYWGVVGLVSDWMGCSVEDLAIVVLVHELAHAYTQLGADIEGRRWPARNFSRADRALKEGLAQYYTDRVLRRLERRFGGALRVYEAMLPGQPDAYRTHLPWIENSIPEAVRRAMLEVRRWHEGKLVDFNRRLAEAQAGLQPRSHGQ